MMLDPKPSFRKKVGSRGFVQVGLLLSCWWLSACGFEIDPRTLWHNRTGVEHLTKESTSEAQRSFLSALAVDPFISEVHTNLGLTYHVLKQGDQALQSYQSAEKWAQNEPALFASRFNQGVLRGQSQKIEEALAAYQSALQARPDSLEAKTNIELLVQSQMKGSGGENEQNQEGDGQGQKQANGKEGEDPNKPPPKKEGDQPYEMKQFEGDLSEHDVKKILGELKQQEKRIREQFNRGNVKERPREKDW
ncbi:MAG: hypothetical protein ACK5Y2_03875 [Bdellovibrionales bacterium]